ncbi:hypothetical protein HJC23_002173 [Cyclotella cryptica]|uniref:GCK domain-containing protein n=1 Tax=Cyclotella cryptica TaxID=29204 RepID=A0ABD3Q750_9STRA|eukprot:CCRYP_008201-RA/>CCRYP_008201-RA protein AED:0.34 eAED:0.34 QI:0/-1/0/1/-1/1/1/0/276
MQHLAAHRVVTRLHFATSALVTVGGACLGMILHSPSSTCSTETERPQRRPPKFGTSIPRKSTRGALTLSINVEEVNDQREDCPLCKKFSRGPCGDIFKRWLDCTDQHPGKDPDGAPMHLSKCSEFAENLAECLEEHSEYYEKDETKGDDEHETQLKDAWKEFVTEMEDQISKGIYKLQSYPANIDPTIHVRFESLTGAAYFKPNLNVSSIVAAYIFDNNGNVLAAGSKNDMDIGGPCVLMFDLSPNMKSATFRAIYEKEEDSVTVFSKTLLVPRKK